MESYATNLLAICGHISFGMDFFTIFLGTPLPQRHMVVVRPGGQFEVIRRLAPGAVCHCRGHDFLDIACRGYRFVIANLHADEPSQVRSASPGRRRVATGDPHRAQHQREAVERLKEIAPRVTRESRSFGMPLRPPGSASSLPSNPRHRRLGSS